VRLYALVHSIMLRSLDPNQQRKDLEVYDQVQLRWQLADGRRIRILGFDQVKIIETTSPYTRQQLTWDEGPPKAHTLK